MSRTVTSRIPEQRFRALVDHTNDSIEIIDPETGCFLDVNESACAAHGYTREEYLALTVREIDPVMAARPWKDIRDEVRRLGSQVFESQHRRKDGSVFPVEVSATYVGLDRDYLLAVVRDISERKRAESLAVEQNRLLKMIARGAPLGDTLSALVRVVESQFEGLLCSVLLLDEDGQHLRHGAAPSLPEEYTRAIDGLAIGPRAGSCGTAMYRKEPVIVTDILRDPLWEDYRALANAHGLRACWSTPIMSHQGAVLGSFAMYYREPRSPSPFETRLIGVSTNLAGIAIERERAENALRESEARYRQLTQLSQDAVYLVDERGVFLLTNPAGCAMFGYSEEEVVGMSVAETYPEAERPLAAERLKCLVIGEPLRFERLAVRKDGTTVLIEVSASPMSGGHSQAVVRDISERKRAERALVESHSLLHAVVEGASDAVFVKDLKGRYLMINTAGARFLGKTVEEVIGKDDRALFSEDTAHAIMEGDRLVIATEEPQFYERTSTVAGVTRTFLATKGVYRNAEGKVIGIFGISRDMTEMKRLEQDLRHAQKMEAIGRLAGGIAHDFNNLLTVINGCSELVFNRLHEDDPDRKLIAEVQKAGDRAANLTRQLLAFSRKQVLQPRVVSLNAQLEELLRMLQRLIGEDIELVLSPGAELGLARVDPGQFEQACVNLALNARDAMPHGGRLTIETYNADVDADTVGVPPGIAPGRYVVAAISDTGVGIDEAVAGRIFEPFVTTKDPGSGTGLGLAMVYGFVLQSGGHIAVSSEQGCGTTFKVFLPRAEGPATTTNQRPGVLGLTGGTETVLVVEDEESVRGFVTQVLASCGYTVLEARDGHDGKSASERHHGPIHILLTDLVMPQMSGRQLADLLAETRPQMRVLFMSGYTDEAVIRHGVQESNVAFLQKPFDPGSLTRKVRDVLDAKEARL